MDWIREFILGATFSASLGIIWWGRKYNRAQRARRLQQQRREEARLRFQQAVWNTALFFPDHAELLNPNQEDTTTRQLIWYLEQATETLQMCLFSLNHQKLEEALCAISRKGVVVKIVSNNLLPRRGRLMKAGVQLRPKRHTRRNPMAPQMDYDLMHHKFVVIDDFAVLTGSANWTQMGIHENRENIVVTTSDNAVLKYRAEFARLWLESEPIPQLQRRRGRH